MTVISLYEMGEQGNGDKVAFHEPEYLTKDLDSVLEFLQHTNVPTYQYQPQLMSQTSKRSPHPKPTPPYQQ